MKGILETTVQLRTRELGSSEPRGTAMGTPYSQGLTPSNEYEQRPATLMVGRLRPSC